MRLAIAQYALNSDMESNLSKVLELMQMAARQRADAIIFPELCLSPFFPQYDGQDASSYVLTVEHQAIQSIQAACKRWNLVASPNVYLQEGRRRFDASLMIGADGSIQGVSKMVHIVQVPGFYEQDYYSPSDSGFAVYPTAFGDVGIVICFDRHYPESTRTCTLRGAQLIVIPTANRTDESSSLFECEIRTAAMQNGVFIAMCNRVGREGDAEFCGESIVVDSDGEVIFKAGHAEELAVIDMDLTRVAASRQNRPYLTLRRPDAYE